VGGGLAALVVAGCQAVGQGGRPDFAAHGPGLAAAVQAAGAGEGQPIEQVSLARAQKPDGATGRRPLGLLDQPPERTAEVAGGEPAARIAATVNGEAILSEEVLGAAYAALNDINRRGVPEPERSEKVKEALAASLNQLVEREVVLQDAFDRLSRVNGGKYLAKLKEAAAKEFEKGWLKPMLEGNKVKTREELRELLLGQGMSLDMVQRNWERNFMSVEYLRGRVFPLLERISYAQILDYYKQHGDEFKVEDAVEWQDLFVDAGRHPDRAAARRFAETLAQRVRDGENFARLIEQFDNGDSSLRHGAGVGSKRGEISPREAEPVLLALTDGEVGPLIELGSGFHVVRLVKRVHAGKMPFDEKVQKQIRDKLRNEIGNREMKRVVADLKRKAVIEYARAGAE
jgi:parvulin-like peptidyl-prolyl isomerase